MAEKKHRRLLVRVNILSDRCKILGICYCDKIIVGTILFKKKKKKKKKIAKEMRC